MSAPRRLWLIVPWALFVVATIGWISYWFYVAGQAEARLTAWAQREISRGGEASFAPIRRHGFPVLMRLEIPNLVYAPRGDGWRAETDRADLHIDLLNPQHVILKAEAPISVRRENGDVSVLQAEALIASIETGARGLVQAGVDGNGVSLDDPQKEGVLRAARLVGTIRPDPRAEGDYQFAFEATDVALPRPVRSFEQFGLGVARLRAAIVLTHGGALLQSAEDDPLGPWRDAGGRLRFEALEFDWGPLVTTGSGDIGIDTERRLSGTLTLPIEEPAAIFTALANNPDADANARQALGLLAAGYMLSGDGITLDVEAANGVLRLEGLGVRTLPAVY